MLSITFGAGFPWRFQSLPENSHALDLCQSHEVHPHLNSRMTRTISSNRRNVGCEF
jgi:hypothetical protein